MRLDQRMPHSPADCLKQRLSRRSTMTTGASWGWTSRQRWEHSAAIHRQRLAVLARPKRDHPNSPEQVDPQELVAG
jgi:hypothetical protein